MRLKKHLLILVACLMLSGAMYAQSNEELARQKAREGIELEDQQGKYDEAIQLFLEAEKLDPSNIDYPYERAYALTFKKQYAEAAAILETLLKHKKVNGRVYQALGNNYDYMGQAEKAIETYEKGVKLFPNTGELYLELGNMQTAKQEYNKALTYYETGIEKDPAYPSNYYWASRIFCSSSEKVWGLIYGEIFMNLEPNSRRTPEISKLLFDTYKEAVKFKDTSIEVALTKSNVITLDQLTDPKNFKLPYGMMYEMMMTVAVATEKAIDLNSLDRIRTNYVTNYFRGDSPKKYPNVLFDYQKALLEAGHLEAYNHWLLMKGDEDAFVKWQASNPSKWENFIAWYAKHTLELDASKKFFRNQY